MIHQLLDRFDRLMRWCFMTSPTEPSSAAIEAQIDQAVTMIAATREAGLDAVMREKRAAVEQINRLARQIAELDAQLAAGEQRAERIQRIVDAVTKAATRDDR